MFKAPFSFEGRIRRMEYGISSIFLGLLMLLANIVLDYDGYDFPWLWLVCSIPLWWMTFAQGAKRCHDIGANGWWQILPFFPLVLLFKQGETGENKYGSDPRDPHQDPVYVGPKVAILADEDHNENGDPKSAE